METVERTRWLKVIFGAVLVLGLAFAASPAFAQEEATIFGAVTDESGAVLPGVTVTASSPALQLKQVTAVTNERGEYRITPLPLGTYVVEYSLSGFQGQRREAVRLTAGFVAKLDIQLKVGAVEETVTVTGASPVVDVKTTSAGTQVAQEILETIPTSRNALNSVMTLAAGARPEPDTGTNLSSDVVFRAFGRNGEAWVTADGLPMSPPENDGNPGFQTSVNYAAIEEAQVSTLGTNAEAPTSGMQINVITKSGSNDFHGTAFGAQSPRWMQTKSNADDALKAQGLGPSPTEQQGFSKRWDLSGDVGGRLVRDRLWFWVGVRNRQEDRFVEGAKFLDGSQSQQKHDQRFFSGKVTYQMTMSSQLVSSIHVRTHPRQDGPATRFAGGDSLRATNFRTVPQVQATWQKVMGNKVLSIQGGDHRVRIPVPPILTDHASWQGDVFLGGLEPRAGRTIQLNRYSGRATLNWYKSDLAGNHDFKMGALYSLTNRNEILVDNGLPMGNYQLRYRGDTGVALNPDGTVNLAERGTPNHIRVGNNPIDPRSYLGYTGIYFQDSWAPNRRLTLNLGLRYAHDDSWLPDQCRAAAPREFATVFPAECWASKSLGAWNPIAPRLHAAYDMTGDGKTVIKGGWGRFNTMHDRIEQDISNPLARKQARFNSWKDLNNNGYFDIGEVSLDVNASTFGGITTPGAAYTIDGPGGDTTISAAGIINNPNLKEQGADEFAASFERELIRDLSLRVTGLYVKEFNTQRVANPLRPYEAYNVPVLFVDPGPDNVKGTGDDPGTSITYYDYPAALAGAAFDASQFVNDPRAEANFKSFELAINKRLSNHWQMLSSFTMTKKHIPIARNSSYNPNFEINSADDTKEWQLRTSGSYQFPHDVQVSSNVLVASGVNWARSVTADGGKQVASVIVWAEPLGTRQQKRQMSVSLGIDKRFHLQSRQAIAVGVQFLNVFNQVSDYDLPVTASGAQLGYSQAIIGPRLGELTLRYTF